MNSKNYVYMFLIFSIMLIPTTIPLSHAEIGTIPVQSFDVNYNIENGNVDSIFLDPDFIELLITMDTSDDGTIEITIPRDLLDAKYFDSRDSSGNANTFSLL